jgi:hypothetical protein
MHDFLYVCYVHAGYVPVSLPARQLTESLRVCVHAVMHAS